jgi:hydroxymethylpyrimidine pyrophosphatase-like HAD family hydrolase
MTVAIGDGGNDVAMIQARSLIGVTLHFTLLYSSDKR